MGTISLKRSWIIWGCAALFFCYQFILRVSPSVMTNELMADFHVGAYTLGLLTSFYYYGYVGMQLPVGAMLDRLGPRRLLTIAAITCTLGLIIFSQAESVGVASVSRFLIGCASACGFLSCMKLGTVWFPPQKMSMVVGFTLLLGTTGAMSGSAPLSFLMDQMSWRDTLWIIALFGLALAAVMWIVVRDKTPNELALKIAEHHETLEKQPSVMTGFHIIIRKPQSWILALYGILMYVPLAAFADMWGVPFLMEVHGFEKQTAAVTTSALYLGVGIGTPLLAFLTDKAQRFKLSLWIGALGAFVLFSLVFYLPNLSSTTVTILTFAAGLFLGGQFLAYSVVTEINPIEVAGSASAFQNMVCLTSGIIFQPVIGWILSLLWDGAYLDEVPHYTAANYQFAMLLIPLSLAGATFVGVWLVREAYPK